MDVSHKVFNYRICVDGGLISTYVFENKESVDAWYKTHLVELEKENGTLKCRLYDLDGLKVGDECYVMGEGNETFIIEKLFNYSKNRWGFQLNSGWCEEVAKCYKVSDND